MSCSEPGRCYPGTGEHAGWSGAARRRPTALWCLPCWCPPACLPLIGAAKGTCLLPLAQAHQRGRLLGGSLPGAMSLGRPLALSGRQLRPPRMARPSRLAPPRASAAGQAHRPPAHHFLLASEPASHCCNGQMARPRAAAPEDSGRPGRLHMRHLSCAAGAPGVGLAAGCMVRRAERMHALCGHVCCLFLPSHWPLPQPCLSQCSLHPGVQLDLAPPSTGSLAALLLLVAACGAFDGFAQGALFGEAALLPPRYTQALVSGTAASGEARLG